MDFLKFMGWRQYEADRIAGVKLGRTASYLRANRPAQPPVEYLDALVQAAKLPAKTWKDLELPTSQGTFVATPGSPSPSPIGHRGMVLGAGRTQFPLVGIAGAAAAPVESAERDPDDFEDFPDELYHPERFCVQITGDSMSPRIEHGDFVLVHPNPSPASGLLVVAHSPTYEYVCKVLQRDADHHVTLAPLNKNGFETLEPGKGWVIDGYVVAIKRRGRSGSGMEIWDDAGMRP